jgi:hypothetical protein
VQRPSRFYSSTSESLVTVPLSCQFFKEYNSIKSQVDIANAEGFAIRPSATLPETGNYVYDASTFLNAFAQPCANCVKLIDKIGLPLAKFRRPRSLVRDGSDATAEHCEPITHEHEHREKERLGSAFSCTYTKAHNTPSRESCDHIAHEHKEKKG